MRSRSWCVFMGVGLVLLFCFGAEAKDESGVKTILVDCDKGDSINKALGEKADELIIKIKGMCQEHVVIERDNVTLLGSDPAVDGIKGPIGDPEAIALVELRQTADVRLENLMITGSEGIGIGAWETSSWLPIQLPLRGLLSSGSFLVAVLPMYNTQEASTPSNGRWDRCLTTTSLEHWKVSTIPGVLFRPGWDTTPGVH